MEVAGIVDDMDLVPSSSGPMDAVLVLLSNLNSEVGRSSFCLCGCLNRASSCSNLQEGASVDSKRRLSP